VNTSSRDSRWTTSGSNGPGPATTSSGRRTPLTRQAPHWLLRSSAPAPAPNPFAHATPAPTRLWTTSSGEIRKPKDTGFEATEPDRNGFVGLPSPDREGVAKYRGTAVQTTNQVSLWREGAGRKMPFASGITTFLSSRRA
jgi:hypothetical protein